LGNRLVLGTFATDTGRIQQTLCERIMRSAGNFHPQWGYFAPAPSFVRTVRITLIATAVGAVAGAAVTISLVDRPAADRSTMVEPSVAAVSSTSTPPVVQQPPSATPAPAVVPADSAHVTDIAKGEPDTITAPRQSELAASARVATPDLPVPIPPVRAADAAMHDLAASNQATNTAQQARIHAARAHRKPAAVPDRQQAYYNYQNYYDYYPRGGSPFEPSPYYRQW
jgi:hypothetical protein